MKELNNSIFNFSAESEAADDVLDNLVAEDDLYDDKISLCVGKLKHSNITQAINVNSGSASGVSGIGFHLINQKLKLPQVPLPEFSNGKNESLKKFLRAFEAIISKHNLTSYEKFIYLQKQLSGGPRMIVDSLDVDQQLYETAKQLLEKTFDCTLNAKYVLIEKLAKLKLLNGADPYSFVGEMRTIVAGLDSLQLTVQDVAQYFIWHALNDQFQTHLIAITNKSKPYP